MINNEKEIWKSLPSVSGVEVSTLGRVRTLDKVVSSEKYTRFQKGRVLKPFDSGKGYLQVGIQIDGKRTMKYVHRLVAQTFINNLDGLPEINHKDNNPLNNNVSNLEWCTREYNMAYKEKYGTSAKESVPKSPVYAVNLKTQETLWFESQIEASRELGVNQGNINNVIKGKQNQTGGFLFTSADNNTCELTSRNNYWER
ncbi:HNH endonuclease [Lactobacillus phage phiJL-1]|uniref:HNH homing endonuclease n=1 Tax=Lactobacillus phage phiJL-1 TaxID=2892345 RepID=Q597W9_9CAUD|nr:HNH endonuclease [Lactobacillus phage phiJL-1]AAP74502.1 putative HNH homing endonuclease [Lactobacillus phage phiJL-1]